MSDKKIEKKIDEEDLPKDIENEESVNIEKYIDEEESGEKNVENNKTEEKKWLENNEHRNTDEPTQKETKQQETQNGEPKINNYQANLNKILNNVKEEVKNYSAKNSPVLSKKFQSYDSKNDSFSSWVNPKIKYELVPPEGGWGHIIVISVAAMFIFVSVPFNGFGILYGPFLSSIGDETSSTTLANAVFNTVQSFTGLAASHFLNIMSYRKVALIGSVIFFTASFSIVFVTTFNQFLITFGILQGLGFGLLLPAVYTAFNEYFDKKKNLMMGVANAVCIGLFILMPDFVKWCMNTFGFRGSCLIMSGIALNNLLAAAVLQPVKWHMKKVAVPLELSPVMNEDNKKSKESLYQEVLKAQIEPLLNENKLEEGKPSEVYASHKPRMSIISLNGRATPCITSGEKETRESFLKSMDLGLLKDPKFLNITVGLSLGFFSDLTFLTLIPALLRNFGFDTAYETTFLKAHFISDFVARIALSVLGGVSTIKNRHWFLGACIFSALFRTAFLVNYGFWWTFFVLGALGFLRAFIQTPLPLVISEEYSDRFASAFSLYMVVCGVVNLGFGYLVSKVKELTNDDTYVVLVLTSAFVLCAVSWTFEAVMRKTYNKK